MDAWTQAIQPSRRMLGQLRPVVQANQKTPPWGRPPRRGDRVRTTLFLYRQTAAPLLLVGALPKK